MKKIRITMGFVYIVLLISMISACHKQPEPHIVSWVIADIDNDANDELLVITKKDTSVETKLETGEPYGDYVEIYSEFKIVDNQVVIEVEPVHSFDFSEIKPSKIQVGDINGDGVQEIAICVYKTAEFHPVLAKRPFFYNLNNGKLEPVWLGSRLARPFSDYQLADIDSDGIDELIAIEYLEHGDQVLTVYDWKGFGFEVKAVSQACSEDILFFNDSNLGNQEVYIKIAEKIYQVRLNNDQIEWNEVEKEEQL